MNRNSGNLFRDDVLRQLEARGYLCLREQPLGEAFGAAYHADLFLPEKQFVVSLKWQQSRGTAEQKITHDAIRLNILLRKGAIKRAYLVLGGPPEAWTIRDSLIKDLGELIRFHPELRLVRYEELIALANRAEL
jgi:hypothetical protein